MALVEMEGGERASSSRPAIGSDRLAFEAKAVLLPAYLGERGKVSAMLVKESDLKDTGLFASIGADEYVLRVREQALEQDNRGSEAAASNFGKISEGQDKAGELNIQD